MFFFFLIINMVKKVIPGMMEKGKGTILFTGCSASLNGVAGFSELCKISKNFNIDYNIYILFVLNGYTLTKYLKL